MLNGFAKYYKENVGRLPRLFWQQTLAQHFDSPSGEFNGGKPPFKCHAIRGFKELQVLFGPVFAARPTAMALRDKRMRPPASNQLLTGRLARCDAGQWQGLRRPAAPFSRRCWKWQPARAVPARQSTC